MIIEYCATRLIPKMKIDFCPNKYRLILLSCPLQLISIDSRSPSGLQSLPNFKMVIKMCFNSRSPSGLRQHQLKNRVPQRFFNSRSPSGLRHKNAAIKSNKHSFNSRSPSGLRQARWLHRLCRDAVSIHAAQAGCDNLWDSILRNVFAVSIHAAQAGCDIVKPIVVFVIGCFNSRSPSGLRHPDRQRAAANTHVSIHAAQAGCDHSSISLRSYLTKFQFTQPKRAATIC